MSSVLTEGILTIAVVIAASTVAAVFVQSSYQLNQAQSSYFAMASDSASTAVRVVFAINSSERGITAWVKNTGRSYFSEGQIRQFDVFAGPAGAPKYIPYNGTFSGWSFSIASDYDSDGNLDPGETLQISIWLDYSLSAGDYVVKVVTHNGISDTYQLSL